MESQSRNGAEAAFPGGAADEALAERAEEVRAWFIQVRGGAPFLSGADARVLLDWLEGGTSVVAILRAIEATAAHRRAKRLRVPFTLKGCARWLGKSGGSVARGAPAEREVGAPAEREAGAPVETGEAELAALASAALDEVRAVTGGDPEAVAVARCAIGRRFHEVAWARLAPRRAELLAAAAAEMGELRELMDDEAFERVCEEAARHRVRGWFPALSVEVLCQLDGAEAAGGLD